MQGDWTGLDWDGQGRATEYSSHKGSIFNCLTELSLGVDRLAHFTGYVFGPVTSSSLVEAVSLEVLYVGVCMNMSADKVRNRVGVVTG